jgi:leucyl aminopeptidase
MWAIAKLKLPVNVIGLAPAVENMPSGISYRQGDIIKAYGGKTIEIGNTDAEGRVILADAIEYAKTKKPAVIITLATLTGSAMGALGLRMSALFVKNNKPLEDKLREVGDASGDLVWPLPLWNEHEDDVVGNFADVTNTSKTNSRYGGALAGAAFLSHFAKGANFAHIDMAPRMTTILEDELARGSAGYGVRYFVELCKKWAEVQKLLK